MDYESYCKNTILSKDIDIFKNNARLIVAGASNSGKTSLIIKLILNNESKFDKIIIAGSPTIHEISSYEKLKNKIITLKHFPSIDELSDLADSNFHKLLIMDDNYYLANSDVNVLSYFTHGRHQNISPVLITQNIFYARGKYSRDISLNATHFIILKSRDLSQLNVLSRQVYGLEKSDKNIKCV